MKISVIIPTYKPDNSLFFCLDSLKQQTLSLDFFEVIVILNGEKQPYDFEIKEYIKNSELNINYYYLESKGVSNARNFGIKVAKGEFITFIDSDDWVSELYLEELLNITNKGYMGIANVLCYNQVRETFYTDFIGVNYNKLQKDSIYSHLKIRSYFSVPWAKLLPAKTCKENFFSTKFDYGEDALYMFAIEPYLPKGMKANENVVYYRREVETSLSRKKRPYKEVFSIHIKLLLEYWKYYLYNINKYNFKFFFIRNLAVLKHIIKKF